MRSAIRRAKVNLTMRCGGSASRRPVAVVYGNCQAAAVRQVLAMNPEFVESFNLVAVPAAHEVDQGQLRALSGLLRRTSLLLTQPIRSDYRGLPLGTEQIISQCPSDLTIVRYPSMYYEGLHPYQVYVNTGGHLSEPAPRTGYHDLRVLAASFRSFSVDNALQFVNSYIPPVEQLDRIAEQSAEQMRSREVTLDVGISDLLSRQSKIHDRSFLTVNHPSNSVIEILVERFLAMMGMSYQSTLLKDELLGAVAAPVNAMVAETLGLVDGRVGSDWQIHGETVSEGSLMAEHLNWYRSRRDVVEAGVKQHAERLRDLQLLG